jgi:hypothetical protein
MNAWVNAKTTSIMIQMMGITFPDSWIMISNSLPFLSRLKHNQQYKKHFNLQIDKTHEVEV